jgi:hypothetical protein
MHPVPTRPVRRPLLALAAVGALALSACGGDDGGAVAAPKGEPKAVADLGFPVVATRNTTRTATNDPAVAAAAVARAIYSGGAAETQARAVAIVDQGDWRAALAATALMAPPLGAPVLFSDGNALPDTTKDAITALRPSGSPAAGGAQAIRVGAVGRPSGLRTTDIDGRDGLEIATAVERFVRATRTGGSNRVLVVSADHPEFAAPAAGWLAKSGDALGFVQGDAIPPATVRLLQSKPKAAIYVLGPTDVITPAATKALGKYGTVRRVGGADPVANAIGFARYSDGAFGWNVNEPGHGFTFARSGEILDAVTLAPFSASGLHGPLLLLDSADRLPTAVQRYLIDVQPGYRTDPSRGVYNRGWLTGDIGRISAALQSQLDALLEIAPVRTATGTGSADPTATTPEAPAATTGTTPTPAPRTDRSPTTRTTADE